MAVPVTGVVCVQVSKPRNAAAVLCPQSVAPAEWAFAGSQAKLQSDSDSRSRGAGAAQAGQAGQAQAAEAATTEQRPV